MKIEEVLKTKKKIYIAMFGDNFVNVDKLVPAEDKEVERLLTSLFQEGYTEGRKTTIKEIYAYGENKEQGTYDPRLTMKYLQFLLSKLKEV